MSAKSNSVKRHENIDAEINSVLAEIKDTDRKIQDLNRRRQTLMTKYEELKDTKIIQQSESAAIVGDWEKETFGWSRKVRETLNTVFKLKDFRPQQLQTINCVLSKKDVLMIAPTGGGKSLCYQLPALLSDGLTVVISPLISLMEDQKWGLKKKFGIDAELLCSTLTDKTKNANILKQISDKSNPCPFKILYVTPERLAKSKRFMNALQKCYLANQLHLIAIDEVHCCSQWGHDFRPDYKFLGTLKTMFPSVPILGVTATATTKVIVDVQKMLNLQQPIILKAEFNRPNLYYHVLEKPSEKEQCIELLYNLLHSRYASKSGIIYTFSIADSEEIASELVTRGLKVRSYHANLTADRRTKIHSKWISGDIQAVVATVAFGMGIDKPNVRFVIHHTLSKSMENFYQESGRAGRDGSRAECILLYRCADIARITTMMFSEHTGLRNAYEMIEFAIDGISCRRDLISKHFLDVWSSAAECNKMCDRCFYKDKNLVNLPKMIITEYCLQIYKIIDHATDMDVKLTVLKLVDAWYHKGKGNLRCKDIAVPSFQRYYAEQIIAFLLVKGYLKEDFHFSSYTTYSYIRKGKKLATADDRIVFYGARVLNLPEISNGYWTDDDCVFVSEGQIKPKKASKKDKKRDRSEYSSDRSMESSLSISSKKIKREMNDSSKEKSDLFPISPLFTKPKRAPETSSDISSNEQSANDSNKSKSKKKSKEKHKIKKGESQNHGDEHFGVPLSQPNEIIEID